jgi:hypothetical protein
MLDLKRVRVSRRDRRLLDEQMGNWDALHQRWKREGQPGLPQLERMLKVEVTGRRRLSLVTRLLGVYHNALRSENARRVTALLARGA